MARVELKSGGRTVNGKFQEFDKKTKSYVSDVDKSKNDVATTTPVQDSQEVGVISSKQGLDIVKQAQEQEAQLSPIQQEDLAQDDTVQDKAANTSGFDSLKDMSIGLAKDKEVSDDFVTYINPETDQEQTLRGAAITPEKQSQLESQGFVVSESNISETPDTTSPELIAAQEDLEEYTREIQGFVSNLENMLISDAELRGEIRGIKSGYDVRQRRTEDINQRRQKAIKTLGVRTGMRYTGGSGGIIGGVISEEERQGEMRIAELEAQKQAAIAGAKKAAKEFNFSLYTTLINQAQGAANQKYNEVQTLKEEQRLKNAQLEETAQELERDSLIAEQIGLGLTSPTDIFAALDGKVPFDSILEITKELPEAEQTKLQFVSGTTNQAAGVFNPVTGKFTRLSGGGGGIGLGGGTVGTTGERFPTDADLKTMTTEQRDFVNKVMRQLPTKLKDSELEKTERMKEALFDYNRGRGIQEVVDEMNGFIIEDAEDNAFGTVLRRLATGTGLELGEISASINNGDKVKAMSVVENANLEKAQGELADVTDSQAIVSNANRVLQLLETAPTDKLGQFDGRKFKVGRFTGMTDDETLKTQQLETALVNLLNEIRRKSLGTAVTESEVQFLAPLLSDVLDQPEIIKTKMDELKVGTINVHNRARSVVNLPEVTEAQLLNNKERVGLYEELAGVQSEAQRSSLSNTDFLGSGAWGEVSDEITSMESDDFFGQY